MNQTQQLEASIEEFKEVVDTLLTNPCLDSALDANLASMNLMEEKYKHRLKNQASPEEIKTYTELIRICLRKFREMMPSLNGEARHVDLYAEQMRGRINSINRIYPQINYN